jgi:cardiolipin synthase
MTLPNILTFIRISLTPLICWSLSKQSYVLGFALFAIAAITDFFDGYIAHVMNTRSAFGAFLDPLADKILVLLVFFFLAAEHLIEGILLWPCALIMFREIFVLGLRAGGHSLSHFYRTPSTLFLLPVCTSARVKTALQMISAGLFMISPSLSSFIPGLLLSAKIMLWAAAFFSILSGITYIRQTLNLMHYGK